MPKPTVVSPHCPAQSLNLDIVADFLTAFAISVCTGQQPTDPPCNTDIDFNNDGLFPDTADIQSLLSVFGGGACV